MTDNVETGGKPGVTPVAGNAAAPFVYFDHAATYGVQAGAIQVELVAATILPDGTGTRTEIVATCHLRCSPDAARTLIGSLSAALAILEKPADPMKSN